MAVKIGIPKDFYGVYVPLNVNGLKPPYDECTILSFSEKEHPLFVSVFHGTYDECEDFAKKNCKKFKR